MVNGLPSKQKWLVRVWLFAIMKKIRKIIGFTKRYNIVVIFILVLLFTFLETLFFAFISPPVYIGSLLAAANTTLFLILLEVKLLLRIYIFYRFLRIKLIKVKGKAR